MIPGELVAREIRTVTGEPALQLRLDMGLLQMHIYGRPDGERPYNKPTLLEYLKNLAAGKSGESGADKKAPLISDLLWNELDREMIQYYHRRLCLLSVGSAYMNIQDLHRAEQRFLTAAKDAQHTLDCMDFIVKYGPSEEYVAEHEQYRPYVLWHKGFSQAQAELARQDVPTAIDTLVETESRIKQIYEEAGHAPTDYLEDVQIKAVRQLIDHLRSEHGVGLTLREQLQAAIDSEKYELAAKLRDQIRAAAEHRHQKPAI